MIDVKFRHDDASDGVMTMVAHDVGENRQVRIKFIEADVYCHLVTSRRVLERSDDDVQGVRGLLDLELGVRYVVEESKLLNRVSHATAILSAVCQNRG